MSRFCILTNTKEFKNAQQKFNLDKYSLEKIVYNYYNNVVNSENTFPSDDYINSIINPTITTEDKKLVDFSKKHGYDKPLVFNNLDNFESKLKEVRRFFTDDLIITYTNSNGQSVIKVANFEYKEKEQKQTKLDKELEEIKRNAIANGTFMKAPNGQPTNLNERQWLQVRTKAFKEWFGDWEKYAKLRNATVIWGHPASGKTYLHKQGRDDIIDFDSEYKVKINKIMGLPEGADAKVLRVAARKERKQEYHDLIMKLFDEAKAEAKRTGKKLLVSDMMLLREREADIDVITNMSNEKFIERSAMRGETDVADKMLWKNDINEAMRNVNDKSKVINTENFLLDDLYGTGVSKVVDKNGEPLVVYHGTLGEFNTFDFDKLGKVTGQGYYTDHITGEKIPVDSSYAFFFTDNNNAARSYKNLAIWQQNEFRALVYRNLQAIFTGNNLTYTKLEGNQKQEQRNFINNIVSPHIGFDVLREVNNIIQNKSKLTEEQKAQYAERFKQIANKIEHLPDARSVSNQAHYLAEQKTNLQYLIDNKDDIISNKSLDYFKNGVLHIASGYGVREKGEVYLTISQQNGKYYAIGIPNTKGKVLITKDNIDDVINEYKKGVTQNENDLAKAEREGKYDSKGNILEVFLNIKNPLEHDYNKSSFPDSYLVSAKEGESGAGYYGADNKLKKPLKIDGKIVPTGYVAARQVRKAKQQGNDGVIYRNVRDPFTMASFGVFNPNQIKSATDNVGTFSRTDNNIYKENIPFENEKAIGKQDSKLLQMFTKSRRTMLSGNKELTAKDLLPRIKDSRYSSIITLLKALNRIGELDKVKVQLVNGASRNFNRRRAFYDASEKTIYVNTEAQYEDGNASSVLLHEILHSITVDRIQQNPELRKEILGIMNEYQAVYYNSRYDTRLDSIIDGHHAMEEFIADVWSNPETINNLKNVKTKENKNKSLWDKFKQFLHNLFSGIFLGATNDSLFAKASSSIIKLLETQAESIAVGKYYENGVYIKPNAEQELAIDIMTDYVTDRIEGKQTHPFFLLNGKAGTGKTTIINMLLERLNEEGKLGNVIVAAVANKAKQNLFRKTNYRELKIKSSSIAGILGKGNFLRQQGSGTNYERVSTKKFGAVIENSDLRGPENIIVIDECSMIETKDYEALLALLALRNLTLIFVGDSGLLPQIQNNKAQSNTPVSKTFTESSVNASATLLTRVRLGEDNPILAASDEFYVRGYEVDNSDPKKNLSLAKLDTKITDKGAFILKNNDQFDYEKDASALFKRAIETGNMNLVKYVCATNEEVSSFNDLVRRSVFGKEYTKMFKEGDIVMFREQFSAKRSNNPNGKAEKIDNSQEGIIKSFEEVSNDAPSSREGYLSPFVLFCKKLNDYAEKHDGKIPQSIDEMGEELINLWKKLPVISTFIYDEKSGTPFYEGTDGKLYNVLNTIYLYAKRIKDIKPVRSVSVEMETQSETASEPGLYEMLTIHPEDWEQYEKNIKLLQNNTYFNETNIIQVITRQLFNAIGLKGSIDLKVLRQLGAEMINNSYTNTRARLQYGYAITSHKSQGSTYDVSIINGDSMAKNKVWGFQDKLRMLYTAITRSSNVTMVITNDAFGVRDTESLDVINERINANKKKTGIDNTGETYKPENVDKTTQTIQTSQSSIVEDKVKTINIDGAATEIEYKYVNKKTDKLPQRSADGSIMMYNVSRDLVLQYLFNDNSYKEALDKLAQEGYNKNYINSIISNDSVAESFVLLNQYIGFIFKDKYKCLKEVFNQLAQNTGNSSPEVAISEPMPETSTQDDNFTEDVESEEISNEKILPSTSTEESSELGEKVEYTPQGKERLTYYIKGSHIYNSKGKEVFVEPSKDRTAIFTNYRVQRGEAVVVEHKGNKYVVNKKDLIVSVRSKKVMEWGEENGDRKAILQLAKQAFELKLNNNQQQLELKNNNTNSTLTSTEQPTTTNTETKDYYLHSGGAMGSDTYWSEVGKEYNIGGHNHYYHGKKTHNGNVAITDEQFEEGKTKVNYANRYLHRQPDRYMDLLARNWIQVKNSEAVFAIAEGFETNGSVSGGTGWAVQMAIDNNKPVYVFDLSTNNWYKRVGDNWVITETPTLTKNFAGIGTRELNESGKQAIRDVYNKTFNPNYQQEKIEAVKEEIGEEGIQDTLDTLNGKKDELNSQERKSAKTLFGTRQPKVLIASETSDPVFHALKIKRMVEAELAKPAYKRNFHMMYIITKHDGLPLADLAKLDIPKFIHFSITSLGGTKYEPGVMKMDDLLDRIQDFINQGVLNPNLITIRIDPIIPGVTKDEDIEHIIERAKSMGIKQFKFSIMDSYGYTSAGRSTNNRDRFIIKKMKDLGYDWDTYYGIKNGVVEFHAKQQYIEHYYKLIDNLAEKHNVWFNTCGENSHGIQDLKRIKFNMGCVSVDAMNAAAGTNDIANIQGNQRRDCSCYGLKSDALRYGDNCQSSCIYCYAGHNQDSARLYYNEDGTLKDDIFTRTTEPKVEQPVIENTPQAQLQESRVKYENPFILEKSEINSENSIYPAEYVLSINEEYFNDIEERADDSMSVLSKFLDGIINFSDLPFGAKIRINTGDDKLDVKIQLLFRKNKLLHSTTEFRTIEVDLTTKEGANFVTYLKNLGVISRDTGTQKSGSVVSKVGIYAYTYVKKQRDIENSKQMKELNDKVSGRRLRSLSIGAIYKISELITQIQDGDSIVDTLFDGKQLEEIKELKGKDRITIIGKVGIPGLALIVKDRYFNVNASEETRNKSLDNLNRKKRKEIKAIYDNFEAFINFGYAKLEELEGVSVDANPHMTQNIIELYDGIDEQEVQELYGSSLEHWLVGFRSVSAVMNLSRLVKSALNSMYDYDIDFNVVKDEYGLEKRVNASEAVSNMLSWFTSVENVEDMIKVLQQKMEKHPWLAQLVNDDPDLKDSEGNLVGIGKLITKDKNKRHPENEEFKSKFFRNMYLYFQRYGIIQSDGNIKVINDKSDIASVVDEVLTNIKTNKELFNNNIPVGKASGNFVDKLIQARKKIADRLNIKGNVEIDDEVVKDVKEIFNLLGINLFNEEAIKAVLTANPKYLVQIAKSTSTNNGIANLFLSYNSNSKPVDDEFWKSYKNDINKIIKPFTDFIINKMESVTYQDGKLYYSYVLPSYMSKFNTKIKNGNGFMEKEFKSEFFGLTVSGEKQWLNEWQKRLATEDKAREDFSHKVVLADNGVSYTKKTPKQYMSSILNEYLYHKNKRLAWYRIPMMSNKPSEEYIRFYRYTEGFKSLITDFLVSTTMQEILRISDVLNRAKSVEAGDLSKDSIIKFYDIKTEYKKEAKDRHSDEELIRMGIEQGAGTRFIMLSFLQPYIQYALDHKNYQGLGRQLLDLILGNNANTTNIEENSELESNPVDFFGGEAEVGENTTLSLLRTAIMHEMNNSFQEFLDTVEAEGVIEKDKKGNYKTDVNKLGNTNNEILNTLEEFFWNDFYAATSIMLLYITDPAYYGTAEELQKRLAQLHAPGSRLNVLARDKNGKLYSANENGKHIYRLIKLADDKVISDAISNINEVFDLLVKENNGNAPAIAYYEAQRKFIISELKKVNVTDAQTFCTPTAMRKKLGMLGEWNEDRENAYQNLVKGKHTKSDLSILMQPLKPFMFSQKQVSDSGGLFNTRRVGVLVKTSEYLLLLADAITRGAGKKTKLATIFDVIEETLTTTDTYGNKVPNGKGIDGISFESSIKTGLSGVINLNNLTNEQVEQTLRRCIYAGSDGTNTTSLYNKTFVDELDYEDYSIQLEVPTHFFGKQQLGSQSKALMFADTEEYERDETGKYRKDENGNKVDKYIYVKDKEGNRVRTTVREAKQRYFRLLADSINNAKEKLIRELNLDNANEGIQNVAISELLKKQILEDSRFGSDLLWAVDTNEKGEFNLPLSDPTHSVRIQLLLYAVIKNRIYKQEIHGGPVVQVSNWGNEDLHIRYTNKDGETLLTEDEFNSLKERAKNIKSIKDEKAQRAERASILNKLSEHASTTVNINGKTVSLNTYEQYKKHHMVDGGVVYECYAPVYDERLLKYENKNGIIDIKRIKQEEPQLLELIGYRIPTEAKYSMASLRIIGFLPREAGEGIMLPKEWTSISGSDFDVDKLYIMRRSFIEVGNEESGLRWQKGTTKQDEINDEIFDIMQGILESNQARSKVIKIGTFDPLKLVGYKLAAIREAKNIAKLELTNRLNAIDKEVESAGKYGTELVANEDEAFAKYYNSIPPYDSLSNNINTLKDQAIKSKNLAFAHVHLQFFKLNMVAAKLIGVFAQSNISHAYLLMYASSIGSERGIQIEDLEFAQFNLFGQLIHKNDFYIDSLYGFDGTPISDNIAAFLAASVDAVKDPILNLMNVNMKTVNAVMMMARMGFNIELIGLLFGQDIVTELTQRMDKYGETFTEAIDNELLFLQRLIDANKELKGVKFDLNLNNEELKLNLVNPSLQLNYTVLKVLQQINKISDDTRSIVHMTRFNSISSAKGPNIIEAIVEQFKTDAYWRSLGDKNDRLNAAILNPVLATTAEAVDSLERILIGNRFVLSKSHFAETYKTYVQMIGRDVNLIDKKDAKKFSDFYIDYMINKVSSLFDLSHEHRLEVVSTYPELILALKSDPRFTDNKFVQSIQQRQDKKDKYLGINIELLGVTSDNVEEIKTDFNEFADEEPEMTKKLIEYMFNRGGFSFSPKTFTNLITNYIKNKLMPEYLKNVRDLEKENGYFERKDNVELMGLSEDIIYQYMLHYGAKNFKKADINSLDDLELPSSKNNTTDLTLGDTFTIYNGIIKDYGIYLLTLPLKNPQKSTDRVFLTVKVDNVTRSGVSTVTVVEKLGGDGQGLEISPNEDVVKSIYNQEKDNNNTPPEAPSPVEPNNPSDPVDNPIDNDYYESLDEVIQEESIRRPRGNSRISDFLKFKSNPLAGDNNYLALILAANSQQPVTSTVQNTDVDIEEAAESAIDMVNETETYPVSLQLNYADSLTQTMVDMNTITLKQGNDSAEIDRQSNNCD